MLSFLKNFGANIKADPASTVKGLAWLAAAAASVYGMTKGVIPVNSASISAVGAMATSGLHGLGSGPNRDLAPGEAMLTGTVETAAAVLPAALTVADHYEAIRKEADKTTATLSAVQDLLAGLQALTPQPPVAPAPEQKG
jgi:hypothetical protein